MVLTLGLWTLDCAPFERDVGRKIDQPGREKTTTKIAVDSLELAARLRALRDGMSVARRTTGDREEQRLSKLRVDESRIPVRIPLLSTPSV